MKTQRTVNLRDVFALVEKIKQTHGGRFDYDDEKGLLFIPSGIVKDPEGLKQDLDRLFILMRGG